MEASPKCPQVHEPELHTEAGFLVKRIQKKVLNKTYTMKNYEKQCKTIKNNTKL